MTNQANLLIWQALTPVHSGTGQSGTGAIDLPIAREVATSFPMLPGSSIKGVLRGGREDEAANALYGSQDAAGSLTFTDARLLCLPVRSYKGTFAYITCPLVVQRLRRDLLALGLEEAAAQLPELPSNLQGAHITGDTLQYGDQVLFEDIDLKAVSCDQARQLAATLANWVDLPELAARLAVVSDDVLTYFTETATEVTAHIRLEAESKTVVGGALWYEEALPAESLLSSFVLGGALPDGKNLLQVGGKGSVGRGLLRVRQQAGQL